MNLRRRKPDFQKKIQNLGYLDIDQLTANRIFLDIVTESHSFIVYSSTKIIEKDRYLTHKININIIKK